MVLNCRLLKISHRGVMDEQSLTVRAPTGESTAAKWATSQRWRVRNGRLMPDLKGDRLDAVLARNEFRRIDLEGLRAALANDQIRRLVLGSCSGPTSQRLTWVVEGCFFDTRDALDAQLLRLVVVLSDTLTESRVERASSKPPTS